MRLTIEGRDFLRQYSPRLCFFFQEYMWEIRMLIFHGMQANRNNLYKKFFFLNKYIKDYSKHCVAERRIVICQCFGNDQISSINSH